MATSSRLTESTLTLPFLTDEETRAKVNEWRTDDKPPQGGDIPETLWGDERVQSRGGFLACTPRRPTRGGHQRTEDRCGPQGVSNQQDGGPSGAHKWPQCSGPLPCGVSGSENPGLRDKLYPYSLDTCAFQTLSSQTSPDLSLCPLSSGEINCRIVQKGVFIIWRLRRLQFVSLG